MENVDSNSTFLVLRKKRDSKLGNGDGHATLCARTAK